MSLSLRLLEVFKSIGGPGSVGFLVVCLAIGAGLAGVGWRQLARAWLLAVLGIYLVLSVPWVADGIARTLPAVASAEPGPFQPSIDTLVVLGGDNVVGRAREVVRAYLRESPSRVIVSGEPWLFDRLVEAGIPPAQLVLESNSGTTRQQIDNVRKVLASHPARPVAVVASRLHMPRVAMLVARAGLPWRLISSPADSEPPTGGFRLLVPTYPALRISRDALYEHAAIPYYRWRGWINLRPLRP